MIEHIYHAEVSPLQCIINLGDIIDGHEGEGAIEKDRRDLHMVLKAFESLHIPQYPNLIHFFIFLTINTYHVLGNHCVWNLGCEYLTKELKMPHRFYDVPLEKGWRFVFLDGTDLSLMKDSHSPEEAKVYDYESIQLMLIKTRNTLNYTAIECWKTGTVVLVKRKYFG